MANLGAGGPAWACTIRTWVAKKHTAEASWCLSLDEADDGPSD